MLKIHLYMVVLLSICVVSDGFRLREITERADETSWPCPMASEIIPCTCESDSVYNLDIDCSYANTENELVAAMNEIFPFDDCNVFIIQDPDNVNNINNITSETFGGKTFNDITIDGTLLEHIYEGAFFGMNTLTALTLSNNKINTFDFSSFVELEHLAKLDLSYNSLGSLPILQSSSLTTVIFSGNANLDLGDSQIFLGLPALAELRLSNINLKDLAFNRIEGNSNLKTLYLNNNELTKLEPMAINPTSAAIMELYLNDNMINDVRSGSITGLGAGSRLYMQNNAIMELSDFIWQAIFDQIGTGGEINLDNNPLLCGCDMKWIALDDNYLNMISDGTTCESGEVNIHELINGYFTALCDDETYDTKGLSYSQLIALKHAIDS